MDDFLLSSTWICLKNCYKLLILIIILKTDTPEYSLHFLRLNIENSTKTLVN